MATINFTYENLIYDDSVQDIYTCNGEMWDECVSYKSRLHHCNMAR